MKDCGKRARYSVLVVGLKKLDAGKTSLAQALITEMREVGLDACGFKPRAGNSIWYDYDIVQESVNQGRLYGRDSIVLKEVSDTDFPEEVINPIHRLWAVTPEHIKTNFLKVPPFIADRVTLCDPRQRHLIVKNDTLPHEYGDERLIGKIQKSEKQILHVHSLGELNTLTNKHYDTAVQSAHELITDRYEAIVYESYSDIALPWGGIEHLSLVLAIEPGFILAYDPGRYLSAVNLQTDLSAEVETGRISRLLKPTKIIKVHPQKSDEIQKELRKKATEFLPR